MSDYDRLSHVQERASESNVWRGRTNQMIIFETTLRQTYSSRQRLWCIHVSIRELPTARYNVKSCSKVFMTVSAVSPIFTV